MQYQPQQQRWNRFPPSSSSPFFYQEDKACFDDDEALDLKQPEQKQQQQQQQAVIEVKTYPEFSAIAKSSSHNNFNILIHIKAPKSDDDFTNQIQKTTDSSAGRAPLDLVAVLDVSGSMAGPKLALMKQAMGFVIQNLGPSDRLSVVSFDDYSVRNCPLILMNQSGKQRALRSVNALEIRGGTNIAAGLHTGAKIMTDRRFKNPVASIIFLSDGCDTHTVVNNNRGRGGVPAGYDLLIPSSILPGKNGPSVPIHTFGFGSDHDPALMNSVAESTRGTFSFIESVPTIQDAFAQCIGGLLSVVVQELQVKVECEYYTNTDHLRLSSIKAGSYKTYIPLDGRTGFIEVGDLYAEEERNFLVEVNIPPWNSGDVMQLLKISYAYKCPISKKVITMENAANASIDRPDELLDMEVLASVEVDRERSRVQAAEAIAKAMAAADEGNLEKATGTLEECRGTLSATRMRRKREGDEDDGVWVGLEAELLEIEKKMGNMGVYMKSGRAMVISGLNSRMQQRAAATGSSTFGSAATNAFTFQTPTMAKMVLQSRQSLNMNTSELHSPNQIHPN